MKMTNSISQSKEETAISIKVLVLALMVIGFLVFKGYQQINRNANIASQTYEHTAKVNLIK